MKIYKTYSHLNGEEFLVVHKNNLYEEIRSVIESVDSSKYKTKESRERGRVGSMVYSPGELNKAFKENFTKLGWKERRRDFFVSDKYGVVKVIEPLSMEEQKEYLNKIGEELIKSYNQTDYIKEGVAVEVQLGKYFAVTYDLFVKHLSFYNAGFIDVGVEIVPSKELQSQMSSGPPFFEKEVHNVLRHGRGSPPVPIVIIGVGP
ncbi:MAG: BglII/BstYI family type II restriction endonuclease [Anaerolineales bacterium]